MPVLRRATAIAAAKPKAILPNPKSGGSSRLSVFCRASFRLTTEKIKQG